MELSSFLVAFCALLPTLEALPIPSTSPQPASTVPYSQSITPYPQSESSAQPPSETLTITSWLPWNPDIIRLNLKPFPAPVKPQSSDPYHDPPDPSETTPELAPQHISFSFGQNLLISVSSLRTSLYAASQPSFWKRKQYFVPSSSSTSPQNRYHHKHYRHQAPRESPLTLMLWFFLSLNALVLAWRMRQSRLRAKRAEQLLEERFGVEAGFQLPPVKLVVTECERCDCRNGGKVDMLCKGLER